MVRPAWQDAMRRGRSATSGKDNLDLTQRIRTARRHGAISQASLAQQVGVHRSAVSHWESNKPKRPNIGHLLAIAVATGVQFEWLATGRGMMLMSAAAAVCDPGNGIVVEDTQELDLLGAFRDVALQSRRVLNQQNTHGRLLYRSVRGRPKELSRKW